MKGIRVCSKARPHPFKRGDNSKIAKIHWQHEKIFFCRDTGLIPSKLKTKHACVKGDLSLFKLRARPFQRGDKSKILKVGAYQWLDSSIVRQLDSLTFLHNIEKKWKWNRLMLFESLCAVCISMFPLLIWKKNERNLEIPHTSYSCCL